VADLVTIFCEIDDFCKEFEKQYEKKMLSAGKGERKRALTMTMGEVMTVSIWYHFSGYATFKDYYTKHVVEYMKSEFNLVSYNRFIELRKFIVVPLLVYLITKKLSSCTGVSFIDSFKLEACHIKRASSHKTLKSIAKKGKTSTGWFYGTKVHLIINHKGEITSFHLSSGNVADNNENLLIKITKNVCGKLFGDKGYIVNPNLFEKLYESGVHMVTKIRANMKNKLMNTADKLLLKKRGLIESVGNILKSRLDLEHTRHRSVWGFLLHAVSSLVAYQTRENKPSLSFNAANSIPA
jgi:hypothetical protein